MDVKRITYLMFDGSYIKIGQSADLVGAFERLKCCQTGNPNELSIIGVTYIPERELHERFARDNVRGEWFRISHELLQFIASPEVQAVTRQKVKGKWNIVKQYV